jgi:DNA-binding Lrp family transcriptional regulator
MDEVDLQAMRRIGLAPFLVWPHPPQSIRPAALARELKVSPDTIKRRLADLRAAGVYHGTLVFPNPRLLGLRMASLHFRLGEAARRLVPPEAVTAVPGVIGVFDMVGGDRCVDVAFGAESGRETLQGELSSLLGAASSHFVDYASPAPASMSPLDWRLVQALRTAPDTTLEQAAQAVGVSQRTAKRRFDRMAKEGCIDMVGLWDPGAMQGHLLVDLVFRLAQGAGPQDVPTILNAFRSRWVAQWSPPDRRLGHLTLVVVARSARELEDLRREGESLACVERCDALVLESARESWGWLDALVAQRAGAGQEAPAAPARRAVVTAKAPARAKTGSAGKRGR